MKFALHQSRRLLFQLLVAALLSSSQTCGGFQPSIPGSKIRRSQRLSASRSAASDGLPFDLSSGLISQLAVAAIRARLIAHTSVKCEVSAKNNGLLVSSFFVGPATVKGRGWQSGRGLTCRAIEATVDQCELDKGQVVAEKRLVLKTPSYGDAMIALDRNDFSNFLAHPLLRPPSITTNSPDEGASNLQFLRDDVYIDPDLKAVTFYVSFVDQKWRCILQRSKNAENRAMVTVSLAGEGADSEDLAVEVGEKLTRYFNDIVFELDGTYLTFRDMMVTEKGASPSVMLKMGIRVEKFPSRNLAF